MGVRHFETPQSACPFVAALWDLWLTWWAVALQILVAFWWWRGPSIRGTRASVTSLFALNALAAALATLSSLLGSIHLHLIGAAIDILTNPVLFWIGLSSIPWLERRPWWRRALCGSAWGVGALAIAGRIGLFSVVSRTPMLDILVNVPLVGAAVAVALGLVARSRIPATDAQSRAWLLALSGLLVRMADLGTSVFLYALISGKTPGGAEWGTFLALQTVGTAAAFVSVAVLVIALLSSPTGRRELLEVGAVVGIAGLAFGAARSGTTGLNATYFTVAMLRPLLFVAAQVELDGRRFTDARDRRWRIVAAAGVGLFAGLLGVILGESVWHFTPVGSMFTGVAFLISTLPLARRLATSKAVTVGSGGPTSGAEEERWPLDVDRVSLPPDWRQSVDANYKAYLSLPHEVTRRLQGLARWERILLALRDAPDGEGPPAYERTTPGLHLATHCPYAAIGPEITRANARSASILAEGGISYDHRLPQLLLVESSWGSAAGLKSGRVRSYRLTPMGKQAADRLRVRIGIPSSVVAASVVGEAFGKEVARPPRTTSES